MPVCYDCFVGFVYGKGGKGKGSKRYQNKLLPHSRKRQAGGYGPYCKARRQNRVNSRAQHRIGQRLCLSEKRKTEREASNRLLRAML